LHLVEEADIDAMPTEYLVQFQLLAVNSIGIPISHLQGFSPLCLPSPYLVLLHDSVMQGSVLQPLPMAHLTLAIAREGTSQNFALWKGHTKQYMATKNADPICKFLSYIA
jgi:hypothetical protein